MSDMLRNRFDIQVLRAVKPQIHWSAFWRYTSGSRFAFFSHLHYFNG